MAHSFSSAVCGISTAIALSACAPYATPKSEATNMDFVTHAEFFSTETGRAQVLDPQVFVVDAASVAATGPQGIDHIQGFRPALLSDPQGSAVFNARGVPLTGLNLGSWLGAKGSVTMTPIAAGKVRIEARFTGLRPNGLYSLFENHFDQKPVGFTPLDGTGSGNSFSANASGSASVTVIAPGPLTHDNAVLLVYHSDGMAHGMERGPIGVVAHHQLIARPMH